MTDQDTTTCTICERPLDHVPRLGERIMHPACEANMKTRLAEASERAARVERASVVARLRVTAREVAEGDAGMSAAEWLDSEADAIERGEHEETR
jgi:hypothetical protein